jgi:predicted phosphodiesterase
MGGVVGAGAVLVFDGGEVGSRGPRGLNGPPGPPGIYADVGVLEARIARLERRLSGVERRLRGARVRSQGKRAVVWAVGDGADGGAEAKAVAARVASERPDQFLYLGDVYADGTAEEFERNYRSVYGQLDRITAPSPGNHEWPNAEEGYGPYWRRAKGRTMPSYYSFRAGRWQLLSLNSEAPHDEDSAQVRWLRRAVAEPGTCRIAFWHRARFSGGKHGDQNDLEPLWGALRGKAAIVVAGHDHDMQRLKPIDGIAQFVSGAGGRSLYEIDGGDSRLAFANDRHYGALRLELRRGAAGYAFISSSGRRLDSGTIRCRD